MKHKASIISPAQLAQRLQGEPPPVLIDVRIEDDHRACRLPRSRSNCVFEVAFLDRMAGLAPDKQAPVCVYGACADSFESRAAAAKLLRAGYVEVWELRDGIEGCKAAGLEVETSATTNSAEAWKLDGRREIDLAESRIEWLGRNLLNKHFGRIGLNSGWLDFAEGRIAGGAFGIDMRTMSCDDLSGDALHDVLIAHLQSDDFFDVENHPEGQFMITRASSIEGARQGAPNLRILGNLTLKGITRPVEFTAAAGVTTDGRAAAQAAFSIDRTEWDVTYGSGKLFKRLGGHLVNDLIELQLRIVTRLP